jgi:hypothetical protein
MPDTGWVFPGTAVGNRSIGGNVNWVSADNIKADDTSTSTVFINTNASQGLAGSNFDFSGIPAGSTIDGIEVRVGDYSGLTSAVWERVKLILADDSDGTEDKKSEFAAWSASEQTDEGGGASDLWSEGSISLSDVQDVDWGFFIAVEAAIEVGPTVDFFQMKVYYTQATPIITDVDTDETWTDGDTGLVITGTIFT